jgi:hypothetical protein
MRICANILSPKEVQNLKCKYKKASRKTFVRKSRAYNVGEIVTMSQSDQTFFFIKLRFFRFSLLSLAVLKQRDCFLMLQTLKLNREIGKRRKTEFGRIDRICHQNLNLVNTSNFHGQLLLVDIRDLRFKYRQCRNISFKIKFDLIGTSLQTFTGSGPCLFCGALVCSKEETEVLNRNSKKSEQLRKKLLAVGGGDPRNQDLSGKSGISYFLDSLKPFSIENNLK